MIFTVICESSVFAMLIMTLVAGAASPTRIRIGTTVQTISALVLWLQVAATAPLDLRNLNMAMIIAPNTMTPIAQHT